VTDEDVEAAMLDAWNDICTDTGHHPLDIKRQGNKLYFSPGHWSRGVAMRLRAALKADALPVAWACLTCNSPRTVDPCPKCGTPLVKPADGWQWPGLPDIERIRELAREVGYAVGVHGSLERDLDLIAVPWAVNAVGPFELAEHIARGLDGRVVDFEKQDKPCGRWACNIHTPDWTKMIDLSVMPPHPPPSADAEGLREALHTLDELWHLSREALNAALAAQPEAAKSDSQKHIVAVDNDSVRGREGE
jgi:hypothetical protein